jgi:hypothetical protein
MMNPDEHERLTRLAADRGLSLARLLVESTLSESYNRTERLEIIAALDRTNRLLANLTGNVNQLAHHANIAEQVVAQEQLDRAVDELAELRPQVEAILRELR